MEVEKSNPVFSGPLLFVFFFLMQEEKYDKTKQNKQVFNKIEKKKINVKK